MAIIDDLAARLSGRKRAETNTVMTDATTRTYVAEALSDSEDGAVYVSLSEDVTLPDDAEGIGVEVPTTVSVSEGDEVLVTVYGGGTMKSPVVTGNPGGGDRMQAQIDSAETMASAAQTVANATGQHFWEDTNGAHVTQVPRDEWEDGTDPNYHKGPNSLWNSLGMLFRDGLNNLMTLTTGAAYTETFEIRLDEQNQFTLTNKPMTVDSVTIDNVATDDYIWLNYDMLEGGTGGGTVLLGSETWYDNPGATLSVTYHTSPALTFFDGLGNLAANIQSYFTATEIGLGGNIYEDMAHKWWQKASVRFFGATNEVGTSLDASYTYADDGEGGYNWEDSAGLGGAISDRDMTASNGSSSSSGVGTSRTLYDDSEASNDYRAEADSYLYAHSEGGTVPDPSAGISTDGSIGVRTITVGDDYGYSTAYVEADELTLTDPNAGNFIDTCTVSMSSAITAIMRPTATYIGSDTTATATANGWRLTWFNTVLQSDGYPENFYTFSNGVITAIKTCSLLISGAAYWNSGPVGQYGFGLWTGTTVESGVEYSLFNYKGTASGQFSVVLPPRLFRLSAGNSLCVGRYELSGAVYRNGTKMSCLTIEVVR